MNIENIKELFADEAFVKELFALETAAEVQAALKEKGVELIEKEILEIRGQLLKVESGEIALPDGELSEEMLEQVAGGLGVVAGSIIIGVLVVLAVGEIVHLATRGKW